MSVPLAEQMYRYIMGQGSGFTGLLDTYTGAAAAYSVRKLSSTYTGDALRVRRSSDDTEQDIGFDGEGNLDTTALTTFVNSGEVFTNPDITSATGWVIAANTTYNASTEAFDLVGENGLTVRQGKNENGHTYAITIVLDSVTSGGIKIYAGGTQSAVISTAGTHTLNIVGGASNNILGINPNGSVTCSISSFSAIDKTADGAVTKWYDQSGNSQDAQQADSSAQPQIISAGSVITENGKAAIDFDGVDDYLQNTSLVSNTPTTHYITAKANRTVVLQRFFDGGVSNSTRHSIFQNASQFQYFAGGTITGTSEDTNQNLHYFLANGTSSEIGINGATASTGDAGTDTLNGLTFAARWDGGANFGDVLIQELIVFNSDQSTNRTGIETNINDHFSIYEP